MFDQFHLDSFTICIIDKEYTLKTSDTKLEYGRQNHRSNQIRKEQKKQRVTKERIFNFIAKTNTLTDQGQLIKTFESMKANGVIFNKPKGKRVLFCY